MIPENTGFSFHCYSDPVLYREPDAERYETAIAVAPNCRMSVANVLEVSIVVEGRGGAAAGHELDVLLESAAIELAPVTVEHVEAARSAWRRFGKGNHRAALNFGDCFAYALARTTERAAPLQGRGFRPHRYRAGVILIMTATAGET